jgi:hypothetical protein
MKIYSGSCCLCDVGLPTNQQDVQGNDLFSGDIVMLWHGSHIGTDIEEWLSSDRLTAIVGNQYKSFSDGTIKLLTKKPRLFTMGISSCGIQNDEWKVSLIKSHLDIIPGEKYKNFELNYK